MTKRNTQKALLLSLLSLLLCFSMLVGTTFAWFTDSVTSGMNKIVAGNLDVDVFYGNPAQKQSVEGVSTLFNDVTLWEPGAVSYENLTVANLGTLALKYRMSVSFGNANSVLVDGQPVYNLPQILKVGLVPGGIEDGLTREEVVDTVTSWTAMESFEIEGSLLANTNDETLGVVIWWEPTDEDNNWNLNNGKVTDDGLEYLHVDLGITLAATQFTQESDSFDNKYDEAATYPMVAGGTIEPGNIDELVLSAGRITVTVPGGSPAGTYKLSVESLSLNVDSNDNAVLDTNFAVLKDGVPTDGINYKVDIQLHVMSKDIDVTHKGEDVPNASYDPFTGVVSFTTDSFSPFAVEYSIFGREVRLDAENKKIFHGFFSKGVNPWTLDASLKEEGGAYMVVSYGPENDKIYSVSERATTFFFGATAGTHTIDNGEEITATVANGQLWSKISGLQNNAHSTVYLLPGTYNEATTIYVYSSMDIIGLGARDSVNVVKAAGASKSNRHLFNCTGTKADYIQVSIRNMHLDATEKNAANQDNAAVQSIRKSKVKCYDLTITKGTGLDAIAFYVNGNNAVDGVKYPAYLYAKNCTLNTTRTFGVVSTAGTYKFWHNNLTYGGTLYTTNNTSTKNCVLDPDSWDW